nr:hypothetical protein CFP56_38834 [Quercus suber]
MPVSHLGLTVSHIPSATSFYLSALHPLGYHYIGQRGDSIGLGVADADLYLTQDTRGHAFSQSLCPDSAPTNVLNSRTHLTPTHVAFRADSRLAVRNCYAAALNAGGRSSGAPAYIDPEGNAFNAAVEDLDGNTLEFIFQERRNSEEELPAACQRSEASSDSTWQGEGPKDDHRSLASKTSRATSRAQTAMQIASATSTVRRQSETPVRTQPPPPGQTISRAATLPSRTASSDFPTKKVFGTILGAAAGAAFAFAMSRSESENAREEREFNSSMRSKSASRRSETRSRREISEPPRSRQWHRNYSVTESFRSIRYPPASNTKAIEAGVYDENDVQEAISRYQASSRRPRPKRSMTYDATEYAPAKSNTERESHYASTRPATMPVDAPIHYLEAPKPQRSMSHTSRRSTRRSSHGDHSPQRRDSVVSMHSHRSHRSRHSKASRRPTEASTIKPRPTPSQHESAAGVPLPASRSPSSYVPPLKVVPPPSYVTAANVALPESRANGYDDADDSDGLGDFKTVVPDDSISCIDTSSRHRHRASSHRRSSRHSSRRSAAESERTVRPEKAQSSRDRRSAFTLPVKSRDDPYEPSRGRKTYSYA